MGALKDELDEKLPVIVLNPVSSNLQLSWSSGMQDAFHVWTLALSVMGHTISMWSVLDCMIWKDKVRINNTAIHICRYDIRIFCRESTKALRCVCSAATALWETLNCLTFWSCHTLGRKYMKRWRSPRWSWQSTSQSSLPSTLGEQICFKLEVLMECFLDVVMWFYIKYWQYFIIFRSTADGDADADPFTYTCSFACCGI